MPDSLPPQLVGPHLTPVPMGERDTITDHGLAVTVPERQARALELLLDDSREKGPTWLRLVEAETRREIWKGRAWASAALMMQSCAGCWNGLLGMGERTLGQPWMGPVMVVGSLGMVLVALAIVGVNFTEVNVPETVRALRGCGEVAKPPAPTGPLTPIP